MHARRIAAATTIAAAAKGAATRRWCSHRRMALAHARAALQSLDSEAMHAALDHAADLGLLADRERAVWGARLTAAQQAVAGLERECSTESAAAAAEAAAVCAGMGVDARVIRARMAALQTRALQAMAALRASVHGLCSNTKCHTGVSSCSLTTTLRTANEPLGHALVTSALGLGAAKDDVERVLQAAQERDARARWAVVAAKDNPTALQHAHTAAVQLQLDDAAMEAAARLDMVKQRVSAALCGAMQGRVSAQRVHGAAVLVVQPQ